MLLKKIGLSILLLTSIGLFETYAQKDYTMQEAVLGLSTNLAIENINNLTFRPQHDDYIYLNKERNVYKYVSAKTGDERNFTTLDHIKNIASSHDVDVKNMPNLKWLDAHHVVMTLRQNDGQQFLYIICQVDKNGDQIVLNPVKVLTLPIAAQNMEWSPEKKSLAYTINNALYTTDQNNKHTLIATDKDPNILFGQSVHRNEFGIHKGVFQSPKGQYTAFYRMDQTMVADYPIINWLEKTATNNNIKYPMAGDASHHVTVGVYNTMTQETVYLKTGEPQEQYLTCVTWDPNEKYIYIAVLNRAQNHMKLNQYDVQSGELVKTLFEEKHSKYVEPQNDLFFLPNGKEFIWLSQRDGFMHAYIYNVNGQLKKQLTKGDWLVKDLYTFDEKAEWLYFSSTQKSAQGITINRVNLKNGKIECFNDQLGVGVRTIDVSTTGNYIIDNFRNPSQPRVISLVNTKSKKANTLLNASSTLEEYNNSIVRDITLTTENSIPLYGKLILPHDFDSNRKYPVVVYLYNGPHAQMITQSFPASGNLWYDYMTQKGFIIWTMDGRGSANRGLEFEQAIHNQLGVKESMDQMIGVNYIKSLPFVDGDRIGIHGWSYGGFMTTYMMTHYPDVFKAGVAGGPVIDWRMYEIMYTERYMSSPDVNGAGYDKNNLISHAKNLKGKLLMIHGADDDVVVWQHSMNFVKACVDNNIPLDYFVYPGHAHNVRGKDRVHLMQKISDYFIQNL